ncbi:hypothetical protein JCM5350_003538 [Sporobolomyces pararoseus]
MHARILPTARLAARYAQTGLQSRVHASKVLNLAQSSTRLQLFVQLSQQTLNVQSRSFTSARIAFQDAKPTPVAAEQAETTSFAPSADTPAEPSTSSAEPSTSTTPIDEAVKEVETNTEDVTKRTVFVGGLSWNVDNQWLEDEVLKALDLEEGVTSVRIARNHLGKSKGFAFVELSTPELVSQLAGQRINIDGREVEFVPSTTGPAKPRAPSTYRETRGGPRNPPSATLWVGNVAWSAAPESLEDAFGRFGEIQRVHQPTDRETGRSRGIAYVQFGSVDQAEAAYRSASEEGISIEGRPIRVDYAETKSPRDDGGRHNRNSSGGFKPRGQNRERNGFRGGNRGGDRREYRGRQEREDQW